jgi:hypothetical protein
MLTVPVKRRAWRNLSLVCAEAVEARLVAFASGGLKAATRREKKGI